MIISKTDIIAKIRKAIDDIAPSATDSFSDNTDEELWQAAFHAVQALEGEMPIEMMAVKAQTSPTATGSADGSGIISLAADFLRFVSLKLTTWAGPVYNLIEPGSDDEMRQRSAWGRGSASKPKVLLEYDTTNDVFRLKYWLAGKTSGSYDHTIESLYYIPKAIQSATSITTALKDTAEKSVIYQAAAIFFEGKKEPDTADKFRNI